MKLIKNLFIIFFLVMFFPTNQAFADLYGENNPTGPTDAQEYGDAIYRDGGANYNHAGIYVGCQKNHDPSDSDHQVLEVRDFVSWVVKTTTLETFKTTNSPYFGSHADDNGYMYYSTRDTIVQLAWDAYATDMAYTIWGQIDWYGSSWECSIEDLENIRCDGLVEVCYELSGVDVWGKNKSNYSICSYPDEHNNAPNYPFAPDPATEVCPVVQRGAYPNISSGQQYTKLRSSEVDNPEVTITWPSSTDPNNPTLWSNTTNNIIDNGGNDFQSGVITNSHHFEYSFWNGCNEWSPWNQISPYPTDQSVSFVGWPGSIYRFRVYLYDNGGNKSPYSSVKYARIKNTVTVTANDSTASEPGLNEGRYRISRDGEMSDLKVYFSMSGSASNGSDYHLQSDNQPVSSPVTIPCGSLYKDIVLKVDDDSMVEGNEIAVLTIDSSTAYAYNRGSPYSATVTIEDNDSPPPPDTTPPNPNPMTWTTEPYAASSTSISMVATTATDSESPPVSYFFDFVNSPTGGTGGSDSSWQTTSYIDTGLQPNHQYGYRVKAKDSASTPNETNPSTPAVYEYTLANAPGASSFPNVTQTSIRANWTNNGNPSGTEYLCENTTNGTNSGWTANTHWDCTGLACGTTYSFTVKAKNGDGVETGPTSLGSQSTQTCFAPDISVDPPSHDFGDVLVGNISEQVFVVSNDGNDTLHVSGSSIVGDNSDQFSIVNGSGFFDLEPGDSHSITVRFSPTSTGLMNASLRILSDDPDEPQKDVDLTGNGYSPDVYVDANLGNNTGAGTETDPWKTITKALFQVIGSASNLVTIHVASGTYDTTLGEIFPLNMESYVSLEGGWSGDFSQRWDFENDGVEIPEEHKGTYETIIDGGGTNKCITLNTTVEVSIDGFTVQNGTAYEGAGIYSTNSSPTIKNCTIRNNSATRFGGGICIISGTAGSAPANITNNSFTGNSAGSGGGISISTSSTANVILSNNLMYKNVANTYGGAVHLDSFRVPGLITLKCTNNTITSNSAGTYAGGMWCYSSGIGCNHDVSITNTILWGNTSTYVGGDLYARGLYGGISNVTITHSDIGVTYGNYSSDGTNINSDPLFGADFHLQAGSPCRNTGDPASAPPEFPDADIDGEDRPQESAYDIGADEFCDSDSDDIPDYWEYKWFENLDQDAATDWDDDGLTDLEEFQYATHPKDSDTDDDGWSDGDEVAAGTDPNDPEDYLLPDYYVAPPPLGDDNNVGTSPDSPLATIQHAFEQAYGLETIPVTIHVAAGTYNENVEMDDWESLEGGWNSDFSDRWDFENDGFEPPGEYKTIIDGGEVEHVIVASGDAFIEGFTIRNAGEWNYGIFCNGSADSAIITYNVITGHMDHGIKSNYGSPVIRSNIIRDLYGANGCGIETSGGAPEISNNIIFNNEGDGIYAVSPYKNIINNTIYSNGAWGIVLNQDAIVQNNIIVENGGGIFAHSEFSGYVAYNDVWNNDRLGNYNFSPNPGTGEIHEDPLFVDPGNGDYHVQTGSRCIDAGDPVETLTSDYTGGVVVEVDSVTAISAGNTIWITDGMNTESDEVADTTNTSITVVNGFTNSYLVSDGAYVFTKSSDFSNEPQPNGGRINMGAYGGTAEATTSDVCEGDFDGDGDVDGSDLAVFAADFGRTDCAGDCEGDFDSDNDVDGSDLAVFAADFGRTDCPSSNGLEFEFEYCYPISENIGGIGLSADDSTLYVAHWTDTWSDKVEWYSTENPYDYIDYVAYGRCHGDVVVSDNNRYIFTSTYYSNNVSRFDLWNTNPQSTQITLPTTSWPWTIALSPDRSKMVVFSGMDGRDYDMGNDALHIFDISNGNFSELRTVNLSDEPTGNKMAFTDNGAYGYFLTKRKWDSGLAKLHEVSMSSFTVTKVIELPSQECRGIAVAYDKLYVSDQDNSMIRVYNRETLTEIDQWPLSITPGVLAIPPNKSGLYVLLPEAPGGGVLEILDLSSGDKIGGYEGLGCNNVQDIEFGSDGSKVYICGTDCTSGGVIVLNSH